MQRNRLYDIRLDPRIQEVTGKCVNDIRAIAGFVNAAQRRLLYCKEAGDEGWFGTFAEVTFNVSRDTPYITLPREIARLQSVDACTNPIPLNNQFFEYNLFGNGRLPKSRGCNPSFMEGFTRNNAVTFRDLSSPPQNIAVYASNPADTEGTRRVFLSGLDENNTEVHSQNIFNNARGVFVTLADPFATAPNSFNRLTGIQKDITQGQVQFFQVDPVTGDQVLLLTMEPGETTAWYRRYYLSQLPRGCCPSPTATDASTVQVTAIAKLDLIPVVCDMDYLLIGNIEALLCEMESIRLGSADSGNAKGQAQERHMQAVRYLNGELVHYLGKDNVAVNFPLFGSARLENQRIGLLR